MNRHILICTALIILSGFLYPQGAYSHGGHSSRIPIDACVDHRLGDVCEYENDHHDVYRGTCRLIAGGLRCARHKPIETSTTRSNVVSSWAKLVWLIIGFGALAGIFSLFWIRRRRKK